MTAQTDVIHVDSQEFKWIAAQIFENECGSKIENLTCWNEGENFMSLGIGHFIWYPRDTKKIFVESFPEMLNYFESTGKNLPAWLKQLRIEGLPWSSREEFHRDFDGDLASNLRKWLAKTFNFQAGFIVANAKNTIDSLTATLPSDEQEEINRKFQAIINEKHGCYPLIDYINFKGRGSRPQERYNGQGWGLLQVLEEMQLIEDSNPIIEFVAAAERVLERRVQNAPPEKNEARWLPGWKKRLQTYLTHQ